MAVRDDRAAARPLRRAAVYAGFLLACAHLPPASANEASCSHLALVAWLLGAWHSESRDASITETWVKVSDTTYEGRGVTRSRADGSLRDSEDLRLVTMGDGGNRGFRLEFSRSPGG